MKAWGEMRPADHGPRSTPLVSGSGVGVGIPTSPKAVERVAGVEPPSPSLGRVAPPAHDTPTEAFGRHFLRCFFCRIGDRYTDDHFCEEGRDLIVAVLDEYADRVFA